MTANNGKMDQRNDPNQNAVLHPNQDSELAAAGPDQKNWRGIGIALLVIIIVCALIAAAILLLSPSNKGTNENKTRLGLKEVIRGQFNPRRFNGTWISDHEFTFQDTFGAIGIYNVANDSEEVLLSNTTVRQYSISTFTISPDRKYLLLSHNFERIFRHTSKAAYLLYNISTDHLSPLIPEGAEVLLQLASWGPTGSQLVFVRDNNVFYMSDALSKPRQLTSSGVDGIVFNGVPDWVYEEEILAESSAIWWSSDGKRLSFVTFNDTEVDLMQYPRYGSYKDINNVYPELVSIRYPKAGKTNPTIKVWVSDLDSKKEPGEVLPPNEYQGMEYYFTEISWVDKSTLSVVWLKRSQNTTMVSLCKENEKWSCKKSLQVDSNGHGWVDLSSKTIFAKDGKRYFLRLPGPVEGSAGRFKHIAEVDSKGGTKTFLTGGKYDVVNIVAHDLAKKTVFYISTLEGKAGERHLFGVTDTTHPRPKVTTCYTCDLAPDCLYNDATFSENMTYFTLECLGPAIPRVEVRITDTNHPLTVLDTNDDLRELVNNRAMPRIKNYQVPIDGNYDANVRLYLPPVLREHEITKYPAMVEVYGGPSSQMVSEKFSVNWGAYLASARNVVYVQIDGRGSGNRGDKIMHEVYRRLGTVEVADQVSVMSYLKDNLPYIDGKHIAIFGWSYGGFASALALANEETPFTCGISVAPVTSWRYYDSVYTERYMQMPTKEDNLVNYEASEVMNRVQLFKGKRYMIIHGSADDNVHWQQSMMLVKALTDAGVLFRMQVYPDENHALGSVKMHLYHTMDDFLDHCYSDNSKEDASGPHSTDSDS